MTSVAEALELIQKYTSVLSSEVNFVEDAIGQVVAVDLVSPINMPPFDQSAMDGYAVNGVGLTTFNVVGEVQAGVQADKVNLKVGEAVRIFTGAVVPDQVTAVIMQERVTREGDLIVVNEEFTNGQNIRLIGEQIEKGSVALSAGIVINPGTAGYLYMLGINEVLVHKKPQVTIIATGNELTSPGRDLKKGEIYESNTYMLKAAFKTLGIEVLIKSVADDFEETKNVIRESLENSDVLITTGGISVGDYDFVGASLDELCVEPVFYKVKQKPGKPIYFGYKDQSLVFGLPGNPAAALSCFYLYVIPAIRKMMGYTDVSLEKRNLKLKESYNKSLNLSHFLKGHSINDIVSILPSQSSAMLNSYAKANCLVHLPENQSNWSEGDEVQVFMLP